MGYVADQIIDFVRDYVDTISDRLKYDKTETGVVKSISPANKPTVTINGRDQLCRIRDGLTVATGDVVIVKVPNNDYTKRYIDGKLKK